MEIGLCPRCGTPYTSSEITGFGILRARHARQGGPRVEYDCQGCGTLIRLVPHGEGRYALPGEPPPAAVPQAARMPPWMRSGQAAGKPPRQADDKESSGPKGRPAAGNPAPEPEPEPLRVPPPEEEVLTAADALALLGLAPAADAKAIERAFRERSLTCHPDKVAHLDREFQELAERKFRRLQRAYDLLSR